jgi:transporter family protein
VVILLSFLFLGERLSTVSFIAILLVLVGCIFIALPKEKTAFKLEKWLMWAVSAALVIGFADFLSKIAINRGGPYAFMFILSLLQLPVALLYYSSQPKKHKQLPKVHAKIWALSIAGIAMLVSGLLCFYMALGSGPASLVSPISGAYVVITVILSLVFLKEKLRKNQLIGVVLAIIGVLLTSF